MATKKQSRPKVKGVVNPKGITQVFGTPIDFKALPEKISINRRLSNGKFKLEAHYPAKHYNDKQNYIGKRKEGSYCRFYDNKSPFFIARTVWDAASQPGMHMMVKNRGETHRFIVTPKVDDPTKASVIGSYLVHRDNGDPVLCSGVIGELEAVGDDGDFKVIPYKNHGIRCPKFDSDKNELAGHIPKTFEYKKSTKPRGPRKTAADYCKPKHSFKHPTDIKKAEMVAAMDDELEDEISCLECSWDGTYEDLIFIDADGTGGGGYDFVLACPLCESDEWLDDMMEAEGHDEPCFSCDGIGHWDDGDCSYCAGSGLMSDTLRAEMAMFNNEYFDADCGCFKTAEGKVWGEKLIKGWSGSNLRKKKKAAEVRAVKHNYIAPCVFCGTTDDSHDFLTVIDDDFVREDWKSKKDEASIPHSICADCADAYSAEHKTLSFMDWAKQEEASHLKKAEGFGADDYTDEQLLKVARRDIDNHIDNGTFYVLGDEPQAFHDGELDGENFYTILSLYSQHHEDEDKAEMILTDMFKKEYPQYLGDESFNAEEDELLELSNKAKERYMDVVEEWEIEDFCDNYDLDYHDSDDRERAISKYLEQMPFDRIIEALDEDDQKRYYELREAEGEKKNFSAEVTAQPVMWDEYGLEGDNDGRAYGIHFTDGYEVYDVHWFATAKERDAYMKEYNEDFSAEYTVEMMDLLTKGKVALKQFVAYDDRDFKDFCKEEDLDYNDPNALQEYVETYDDVALIEMLNDDEQGRYYELKESLSSGAKTFEAPYAGAGALMGIKGDSALSSFTTSELTESSAIHGDFDQASLNYSGHQNLEVRAEDKVPRWAKPLGLIGGLAIGYISAQMIDKKD